MKPARHFLILASLLLAAGVPSRAADSDAEIQLQRQLDQPLSLEISNQPLRDAFQQIAAAAKIPLQIDPACYELLPYGGDTRVTATFKQSQLREGLDYVLIPLGLQKTIAGSALLIQPSSPLRHIGRRAELEELKLLNELWQSEDLKKPATGKFNLADAIRAAMDTRKELIVPMPGDANGTLSPTQEKAIEQIGNQLPMSAYRALDMYCQLTGEVWFVEAGPLAGGPTGGKIMIMSPRKWIERQLQRPIKISRTNEPLEVVVADLTHASGIRFVPEPGLYQAVPAVNLQADNATVLRTLEFLAGGTRIAFDIRDDSILLYLAPGPGGGAATQTAPRADSYVGRITIPIGKDGTMMDLYLRESDLPPDANAARLKWLQQAREELLKSSPPTPASTPAGKPATGSTSPASTSSPATAPAPPAKE